MEGRQPSESDLKEVKKLDQWLERQPAIAKALSPPLSGTNRRFLRLLGVLCPMLHMTARYFYEKRLVMLQHFKSRVETADNRLTFAYLLSMELKSGLAGGHFNAAHVITHAMQVVRECDACKRVYVALPRCSRCRMVGYCNVACQRAHWAEHQKMCRRI